MKPNQIVAKKYFHEKCVPRRVRDTVSEEEYYRLHDAKKIVYRRVLEDEKDRGELYPVWSSGFQTFSNFGIGVGIYFMHLILLAGLFFICGLIMIVICYQYDNKHYGDPEETNGFIRVTAACPATINITATMGCDNGESTCLIKYRPNCDIPSTPFTIDLVMSTLFAFALFASSYLENHVIQKLDEAIQTAQDYSVVVLDPNEDAENPDEWYAYFSRFGEVKCISIIRHNESILRKLLELHTLELKIKQMKFNLLHINQSDFSLAIIAENHVKYTNKLNCYLAAKETLLFELHKAYLRPYPVVQVYATFEYEQHQKLCLESLEVPDIAAMLDLRDPAHTKYLFRQSNVLNVKEAPEPDNILWQNITISNSTRWKCRFAADLLTVGVLIATWFLIDAWQGSSSNSLAVLIGIIDTFLPVLFDWIVNSTNPTQDSKKQALLQVRLFGARLLLSSFIPYWQVPWYKAVESEFIKQLISIQFTASFTSSVIALMDIKGHIDQYIIAPWFAETQAEYNAYWNGSTWSLAEKYTTLIKIICVTLFYSVLIPYSLFFGMLAFFTIYLIDRYLLLRRWRQVPMLDNAIAVRLRQQGLFAICCHMYISYRFLYSWPMDETYIHAWNDNNKGSAKSGGNLFTYQNGDWVLTPNAIGNVIFEKVNKFPGFNIYSLPIHARWHNENQQYYLPYYLVFFTVVLVITLLIWIVIPTYHWIQKFFFKQFRISGEAQGIPFSALENLTIYDHLVYHKKTNRSYQCSYAPTVPAKLRKRFVKAEHYNSPSQQPLREGEEEENDEQIDDLSVYVPDLHQPYVLSVIKYYPSHEENLSMQHYDRKKKKEKGKDNRASTDDTNRKETEGSFDSLKDDEDENEEEAEESETEKEDRLRKDNKEIENKSSTANYKPKLEDDDGEEEEPNEVAIRRQKSVRFQRPSNGSTTLMPPEGLTSADNHFPTPLIRTSSRQSNKFVYQLVSRSSSQNTTSKSQLAQLGLDEDSDPESTPTLPASLLAKITPREVELTIASSSGTDNTNNKAFSKPRRYFSPDASTSFVDLEGNKKVMVTSLDL